MLPRLVICSLSTVCLATAAGAAPVGALSELTYSHSWTVTGGFPSVVGIGGATGIDLEKSASTFLDAPLTNLTEDRASQTTTALINPSAAYFDRLSLSETVPDDSSIARAVFDINFQQSSQQSFVPFGNLINGRETENSGAAEFVSLDGTTSGEAAADYSIAHSWAYTNQSGSPLSFTILGEFSAELLAGYEGGDTFARTSLSYGLGIDADDGVNVTYLPLTPYLRDIEDGDVGATVSEALVIGDNGFTFSASTTAAGSGGAATASLDGGFRYALLFTMAAGSSFSLSDSFTQTNFVEYRAPVVTPVPLPASLSLLAVGALLLGGFRVRKRS